jgi:hypothetical protein
MTSKYISVADRLPSHEKPVQIRTLAGDHPLDDAERGSIVETIGFLSHHGVDDDPDRTWHVMGYNMSQDYITQDDDAVVFEWREINR